MKIVDTNGCEFGYELIMVLPYVYYLSRLGKDVKVITCRGMRSFYYFLPEERYEERYFSRKYSFPIGTQLKTIHFPILDLKSWVYPNYSNKYKKYLLKTKFSKPILIISNKYTSEWNNPPINYLSLETLSSLFTKLSDRYCIIYNRCSTNSIPGDAQHQYTFEDHSLIEKNYPYVYDINKVYDTEDYDFNTLQLILGSKAVKFISVQGGTSILYSSFGKENNIYAIKGGEVDNNSYLNWYSQFSNATIRHFTDYSSLINSIE